MSTVNTQLTTQKRASAYGTAAKQAMSDVGKVCPDGSTPTTDLMNPTETYQPSSGGGMDDFMKMYANAMEQQQKINSFTNLQGRYADGGLPQTAGQLSQDLKIINGVNSMYCPKQQ